MERSSGFERGFSLFEKLPVLTSHKVGILYVARNQKFEAEILANQSACAEFYHLLKGLGYVLKLEGNQKDFLGGLDSENGVDGKYSYNWKDQLSQIIFHINILMPTMKEQDPLGVQKKKHIGNDFVTIIFNDSDSDYDFETIPGQFNFYQILVTPTNYQNIDAKIRLDVLDCLYSVTLQKRSDLPSISPLSSRIVVSSDFLPTILRSVALKASIIGQIFTQFKHGGSDYASTGVIRLRHLKQLARRQGAVDPNLFSNVRHSKYDTGGYLDPEIIRSLEKKLDFTKRL